MRRINKIWSECEDGHITAGENIKSKCDAELWQLNYSKGKRKGQWITEKTKAGACGKTIIGSGEIPEELNWDTIWDHKACHAFFIGQKLDAEFIISLQSSFVKLKDQLKNREM